ncbi:MAG: hypothetical protein ACRD6X_15675 [Pyrinomonadaceae bacterium]
MNFLAFETNVLGRIEFESVAIPFAHNSALGVALKRRGKRVTANDILQSGWTRNLAALQNNTERLSDTDLNTVLADAYVPGYKLTNPALQNWFGEVDAWWFDNVRRNIDRLESPYLFASAASLAMEVGDYALSFDKNTRELRQPLSVVYRRLWENSPVPVNNSQNNNCQNKIADEFLAESIVELMFLELPQERPTAERWREEWLRGNADFWPELESARSGKLDGATESRSGYLKMLEKTLSIASNIKHWAIAHIENASISTQDIVDTVNKIRRVESIYTKDFSELTGAKAVIVTA